ncbi:ABC transporter substrate-binding protein [Paenibacillus sp. GP183]|jgi:peptide/nickel transport system substrate-binding protein|uniref:ABC transporter substrate-binding protein n=1 Tax=Paenibacillus sp. GP183 TaxID=1882751 RepID=UPI0008997D7F|nr:ABC transporter substrate-binding protein [Paenibacillus sp. GP183]SEB84552.1 peptide/nickel transport system substrate-binding protein [Paenibacillus sp. GP183]
MYKNPGFKKLTAMLILFSMIFYTAACSNNGGGTAKTAGGAVAPSKVTIARPVDSDNLDPVTQSQNANIWVLNLLMNGLVKSSDDGTKIEPDLAKSWDISPDGLTYTFHLLDGLKFSDGTAVKGEDWIFSLTRARDEKGSIWTSNLKAITKIAAPDDKTVVLTLDQPFVPLLAALAMFNAAVLPKAYFEKVGVEGFSQKPAGTGPYMLDKWVKGEYISLKKNPNYRVQGLPKTDEIKLTVVPDDNTRMLQLQSGDIDVATFVPYNKMKELSSNPDYTVQNFQAAQVNYLTLNTAKKPLDNVKVRQALNYAIDKQGLVNAVLNGYGTLGTTFFPSGLMYYDKNLTPYKQDLEKAKSLLAEAGFANGGIKLELLTRSGDAINNQVSVILKDSFSKIGVDLTIKQLESATVSSMQRSFNYDLCLNGWSSDMVDPAQVVDRMVVYNDATRAFYTGWKDDTAIQMALDAKKQQDAVKRQEMYSKIQGIHASATPLITLYNSGYPVIMKKNITGFSQTPLGNYRFENLEKKSK